MRTHTTIRTARFSRPNHLIARPMSAGGGITTTLRIGVIAGGLLALSCMVAAASSTAGTVVGWGWGYQTVPYVAPGARFTAVAAGSSHSLALKADGSVVAWGADGSGRQSSVPDGLTNVIAIAAGSRADGTVVAWGSNSFGESTVPEELTDVIAIAAGGVHSLALKTDGTVVAWGGGPFDGTSSVPEGLTNVIAIAAGDTHNLALIRQPSPVIQVQVSWPTEYSTAILESAPTLNADSPWTAVPGSGNPRTIALSPDREFFRLRIP